MKTWTIYEHISPSGKIYVGITSKSTLKRWGNNGSGYLNKSKGRYVHTKFAAAILKYGWNNFQHKIIATNLGPETAKNMEKDLIKFNKDLGISYNITDGGDGTHGVHFKHTLETREKILKNLLLCRRPEVREKIRNTLTGKKRSKEACNNCKLAHLSETKAVYQYNRNFKLIAEFNSIMEASRTLNIPSGNISGSCREIQIFAGGFKWGYKEGGKLSEKEIVNLKDRMINAHKRTKEQIEKQINTRRKKDNRIHILQYDLEGNFINEFLNIDLAAEHTNLSKYCIYDNIRNKIKSAGGYIWKKKNKLCSS